MWSLVDTFASYPPLSSAQLTPIHATWSPACLASFLARAVVVVAVSEVTAAKQEDTEMKLEMEDDGQEARCVCVRWLAGGPLSNKQAGKAEISRRKVENGIVKPGPINWLGWFFIRRSSLASWTCSLLLYLYLCRCCSSKISRRSARARNTRPAPEKTAHRKRDD